MTDKWTIYRTGNGEITGVIESPDPETVALNICEDEAAIPGEHAPGAYYVADGEALPLPPKPGPWAVWTGGEWADPRTEADMAAELHASRSGASLSKAGFVEASMSVGLLTPAEAEAGAGEEVPSPFAAAVDAMPLQDRTMFLILWRSGDRIGRMSVPFISLAGGLGLSDHTRDAMFGLIAYDPNDKEAT